MNTFTYSYPVKVYFGEKAAANNLQTELAKVGDNVLLALQVYKKCVLTCDRNLFAIGVKV